MTFQLLESVMPDSARRNTDCLTVGAGLDHFRGCGIYMAWHYGVVVWVLLSVIGQGEGWAQLAPVTQCNREPSDWYGPTWPLEEAGYDEAIREALPDGSWPPPEPNIKSAPVRPLWTSDMKALDLHEIATRAAPILHFSPNEFLLRDNPLARLPTTLPSLDVGGTAVVYYRVRRVHLRRAPEVSVSSQTTWSCDGTGDRPFDDIDRIFVRYMFYYPQDEGIGNHVYDLEAVEVQLRSRAFCYAADDVEGGNTCFYGLVVTSVSGAAHGVDWYTNVLNVERAADTVLPLTILVEENKHASSPDRNGDGNYMPHYDTNVYTNDAWGVRDVVGHGMLGGVAFGSEGFRLRRDDGRVFPPEVDEELREFYTRRTGRNWGGSSRVRSLGRTPEYVLRSSVDEDICDEWESEARDYERALRSLVPRDPKNGGDGYAQLARFMDGHGFCRHLKVSHYGGLEKVVVGLGDIVPGPKSEFGFPGHDERVAWAYRWGVGHGFGLVLPIGMEVPVLGGWIVTRVFRTWGKYGEEFGIGGLYTPSASRVVDWYVGLGGEADIGCGRYYWGMAGEMGVRVRFGDERLPAGFEFLGLRAGVRARIREGLGLSRPSLVFEIGGGPW